MEEFRCIQIAGVGSRVDFQWNGVRDFHQLLLRSLLARSVVGAPDNERAHVQAFKRKVVHRNDRGHGDDTHNLSCVKVVLVGQVREEKTA